MQPSWRKRILSTIEQLEQRPNVRRGLSLGTLLCTVGFLLWLLSRNATELAQINDWSTYLGAIGIGFFLYPVSLGIQAFVWQTIMVRLGQTAGGWWDIEIYAYTHLARRLPGAVWYLAGRTVMYHARGIGAGITLASSGLEWTLLLIAAAIVYGSFGIVADTSLTVGLVLLCLLIALASLILHWVLKTGIRFWPFSRISKRLKSSRATSRPRIQDFVLWLALYALCYLIGGGILLILARSIAPDAAMSLGAASRIWALGGGVGFLLSAIIPAGLGVRELTLTVLLTPYLSTAVAVLVAVLLRLLFTAGDLVWGLALWGIARLVQHYRREDVS